MCGTYIYIYENASGHVYGCICLSSNMSASLYAYVWTMSIYVFYCVIFITCIFHQDPVFEQQPQDQVASGSQALTLCVAFTYVMIG